MCLQVSSIETRKKAREIAKGVIITKDLVVYKGLYRIGDCYKSPFQLTSYEPGNHYYQIGKKFSIIIRGYSSIGWIIQVYEGLHAYVKPPTFWTGNILVEMIIPKGSTVIYGDHGDIVTDNLIFPEKITKIK